MSTKALREVIQHFQNEATFPESPRAQLAIAARAELAAIEQAAKDQRNAVLSEVRERFAKHADDLRRQGDDDTAEIVNDLHDWIYEMETK